MLLLTFASWIPPEKPTFLLLSRPYRSILHTKQVELALVHREPCEIRSFHKDAKSTNQQNKFQN